MKIDLASDLHLDFNSKNLNIVPGSDTLVLAGDVFEIANLLKDKKIEFSIWLTLISAMYKNVVWVFGNHEFYEGTFDYCHDQLKSELAKANLNNFHILQNETIEIEDAIFFGATLWTSVHNSHPVKMMSIGHGMNDYKLINKMRDDSYAVDRLTVQDTIDEHNKTLVFFREFAKLKTNKKKVAITHHAPSFMSVNAKFHGDYLNDAYATDLYEEYFNSGIILSVHGHIHDPVDYMLSKTRVVSNPRGYYGYEKQATNYNVKTIEF